MSGKVALVTGGARGIGAATCRLLAAQGCRVVVNYATSADAAHALAAGLPDAVAVQGDVADDAQCRAVAEAAMARFGRLDVLVNNAGKTRFANHEDLDALSADDFIDIYRVNVVGAYQMTRACVPALRAAGSAAVVNVASVAGLFGIGSSVAYAASKGAMITMTKGLARALAPEIRVNAVCPGYVGTDWFGDRLGADGLARLNTQIAAMTPLGLAAQAEDIAAAIADLASLRLVSGETLIVDAGWHLDTGGSRRPGRELR